MAKDTIKFEKSKKGELQKVKLFYSFSSLKEEQFKPKDGKIGGVAVPYNRKTDDWRNMSFAPNAFKDLKRTPLFVNHDSWDVKAMVGATEYENTPLAVMFKAELNTKDDDVTKKIIPLIEMKALEGVSIGARIKARETILDDDGEIEEIRITDAEIYELSLVTFAAFDDAKINESMKQENNMGKKADKIELSNEEVKVEENEIETESGTEEPETTEEQESETGTEEKETEETETEEGTETETEGSEETESEETPDEEVANEEDGTEGSEEASIPKEVSTEGTVELSKEDFAKVIAEKDAEIAKLNKDKTDTDKNNCIEKLIAKGIVYNSQKEKVLQKFSTAEAITEFYKDVPASFSVEPKGESQVDVTTDEILKEQHKKLATETSLSEEDFEKYNK